jgi:hypothetical protein
LIILDYPDGSTAITVVLIKREAGDQSGGVMEKEIGGMHFARQVLYHLHLE